MEVVRISPAKSKKIIPKLVEALKEGKVLILPTDTVYGLVCDATNKKAVEKVFQIKNRPISKPLPVFVKDINSAKSFASINSFQEKFLKKAWPGKITVVLRARKGDKLAGFFLTKNNTIALRVPNHKLILGILKKTNKPLTATSANISGEPDSTKFTEVFSQFKNKKLKPDLLLDVGDLPESLPSTIINFTTKKIKILRKGEGKIRF